MTQPSGLKNLLRAAAGALPVVPRTDQLPNRTVTVEELPIDPANVAAYAAVTGLRYGNQVPLTYPFALTFPSVMSLVTGFDFRSPQWERYTPRTTSRNTGRSRSPTRWACGCARRICANTAGACWSIW